MISANKKTSKKEERLESIKKLEFMNTQNLHLEWKIIWR